LYSCTYCCNSLLRDLYKDPQKYFRKRSVMNVIDELTINKKRYAITLIRFHDDIFTADRAWLREFCDAYKKKIGIPFSCYVHPNTVDNEVAALLKEAGCCEAEIGVQTIHKKTQEEVLNRFVDNAHIEEIISIFKRLKIRVTVNNIFGIPGQTVTEILDLARFYNKNRVTRLYFYGLRYYPKTKIVSIAREKGILKDEDISSIEKGEQSMTFVRGGHLIGHKELGKIRTLFTVMPFLPYRINDYLIKKRLHRFFPRLPYYILIIFSNWLRISYKYNWMLRRTLSRYAYFTGKKLSIPQRTR
jgi:anaerobic magnesium-protoporphyrin IX monomethyl ester cyclase